MNTEEIKVLAIAVCDQADVCAREIKTLHDLMMRLVGHRPMDEAVQDDLTAHLETMEGLFGMSQDLRNDSTKW